MFPLLRKAACALLLAVAAPSLAERLVLADPLLADVHGLSFSSDGRALFVSSHTGLAVFREGIWAEVDGPIHDFVGFSSSASAMYASGHPPKGSRLPDPLGLIRSVDGGQTWQALALEGEADFHRIAAGYRSGAIYVVSISPNSAMPEPGLHVTRDGGRHWRRATARGLEGAIFAIAAHPLEAGTVAVATDKGLYLARDSGDSFRRADGRQAATAVAFDVDGRHLRYARATRRELVSIGVDDRTRTVRRLPPLGLDIATHIAQSPADPRVIAVATDSRDVFVTNDGGANWRQIARDGEMP